jgi:hypothetical protein
MDINFKDDLIEGEGNKLYSVVIVDNDDEEDTSVLFFRANDEDHLFDEVKLFFIGYDNVEEAKDDPMWEAISNDFENDWGHSILVKELGEV